MQIIALVFLAVSIIDIVAICPKRMLTPKFLLDLEDDYQALIIGRH